MHITFLCLFSSLKISLNSNEQPHSLIFRKANFSNKTDKEEKLTILSTIQFIK